MESTNTTNSDLDDIQYLLHLESLKRYTEEAKNMQRQVEEHARNFVEAKRQYQREFARLVSLSKNINLCETLDANSSRILDTHVANTSLKLSEMSAALANEKRPNEMDMRILEECKLQLERKHRPRIKLAKHQINVASNREALKTLRTTLDNVENGFELSTLATMDQLTIELQPPQPN